MSEILESYIEDMVCKYAKRSGFEVRKLQWIGTHSAPDRIFMKHGRSIFMEFKRPGEQPRLAQKREIKRLRRAGMLVFVVDNCEDGIALLDEYK